MHVMLRCLVPDARLRRVRSTSVPPYVTACFLSPFMTPSPPFPDRWTGSAAVGVCLAFFLAASLADPGYITPHNAHAHQHLYPCDGALFEPGAECWTCGLEKPARSKHCNACGR